MGEGDGPGWSTVPGDEARSRETVRPSAGELVRPRGDSMISMDGGRPFTVGVGVDVVLPRAGDAVRSSDVVLPKPGDAVLSLGDSIV